MACYSKGEYCKNRSMTCNECPASNPGYAERYKENSGCEYCDKPTEANSACKPFYQAFKLEYEENNNVYMGISIIPKIKQPVIHFEFDDENSGLMLEYKINYCPMCGRRLKNEA